MFKLSNLVLLSLLPHIQTEAKNCFQLLSFHFLIDKKYRL